MKRGLSISMWCAMLSTLIGSMAVAVPESAAQEVYENWSLLPPVPVEGFQGISEMDVDGSGNLIVVAWSRNEGGQNTYRIARWDGANWSLIPGPFWQGPSFPGTIYDLTVSSGGGIYVGGRIQQVDGVAVHSVAKWNGLFWSGLDGGLQGPLNNGWEDVTVVESDGNSGMYVGGYFQANGRNIQSHNIAYWDGFQWHSLGSGTDGPLDGGDSSFEEVTAITPSPSGDVYVGGLFDEAGGKDALHIARWDGSEWHALGEGIWNPSVFNIGVSALVYDGQYLYAAGGFTMADREQVQHVARWDGEDWTPMGEGLSKYAYYLDPTPWGLLAIGNFTHSGARELNHIARWDGDQWLPVGSGLANDARVAARSGSILYVASRSSIVPSLGPGPQLVARDLSTMGTMTEEDYRLTEQVDFDLNVSSYPNPFSETVNINVAIGKVGHVRIDVVDPLGRVVDVIADGERAGGTHGFEWRPSDHIVNGTYLIRLETASGTMTRPVAYVH